MNLTDNDKVALKDAWLSYGGRLLVKILDEMAQEPKDELWEIMSRKPDTLTGKSAIKLAVRSKALRDFKETVDDTILSLNPQGQGR